MEWIAASMHPSEFGNTTVPKYPRAVAWYWDGTRMEHGIAWKIVIPSLQYVIVVLHATYLLQVSLGITAVPITEGGHQASL